MADESTTAVIQRYLDALRGDRTAELAIRQLVDRAVGKLSLLCVALLHKSYPRLARPPVSLETDELLGGVVAGLLTAMRTTRPRPCAGSSPWPTPRQPPRGGLVCRRWASTPAPPSDPW